MLLMLVEKRVATTYGNGLDKFSGFKFGRIGAPSEEILRMRPKISPRFSLSRLDWVGCLELY